MNIKNYKKLYEEILEMSYDMEEVSVYCNPTDENIEKCKWIAAILEVLNDVPKSQMECMFEYKDIAFDYIKFMESENY